MDNPAVAQAVATFIGALSTAVLLYAASHWGPNGSDKRDRRSGKDRRGGDDSDDE